MGSLIKNSERQKGLGLDGTWSTEIVEVADNDFTFSLAISCFNNLEVLSESTDFMNFRPTYWIGHSEFLNFEMRFVTIVLGYS